jgi:hypothetical protein
MYKGKYEQNQTPAPHNAARVPAQQDQTAPVERPTPQRRPPAQRKRKKATTTGTYVFYGVYLAIILIFFIGIAIGMGALKDFLINFQAAQPETKSDEIFAQLFADPDWGKICLMDDPETDPVVVKAYEKYMTELVGDAKLTYIDDASGDPNTKAYVVCHGTTGVARFTLVADNINAQVPNWQFGTVDTLFDANLCFKIVTLPGNTVKVNGETLGEDDIARTITTKADEYLPKGVRGYGLVEYQVSGLKKTPELLITDETGERVETTFDEATLTFSQILPSNGTITAEDSEYQAVLGAAKAWTEYMIKGGTAGLKKYYDTSTQAYKNIVSGEIFRQSYSSYSFGQEDITEYYRYSDTLFSAKIHLITTVVRKADGYNKEFEVDVTYIFKKTNGKWMVYDQVNVEIQEQITQVRLSFEDGKGNLISNMMVSSDAKTLTPPAIDATGNQVLAGWYQKTTDILGNVTLTPVFDLDENGNVYISEDLEPMVLIPRFESNQEAG